MFSGFFSKREYLSIQVVSSALGLIGTVSYELISGFDWQLIFVFLWSVILRFDYKAWKKHKDDDDDDHRKKRWSWVKNRLPKPETRTIPQPI
jgi:hypothetical protein